MTNKKDEEGACLMIQAMPGKVVIKKINAESSVRGIYLNTNSCYYSIESIVQNEFNLQVGDKIIIDENKMHRIIYDNCELGIINFQDILAVIK